MYSSLILNSHEDEIMKNNISLQKDRINLELSLTDIMKIIEQGLYGERLRKGWLVYLDGLERQNNK